MSQTVIMREGAYDCSAIKMHLKLRDQQFKIITYTYTQTAIQKPHGNQKQKKTVTEKGMQT